MRFRGAITTAREVARCLYLDSSLPFRAMVWNKPFFPRRSALGTYLSYREAWRDACEDLGYFPRPRFIPVECTESSYVYDRRSALISTSSEYDTYFSAYHELSHAHDHHVGVDPGNGVCAEFNTGNKHYVSWYASGTPRGYYVKDFLSYTRLPWEVVANTRACDAISRRARRLNGVALLPTGVTVDRTDLVLAWWSTDGGRELTEKIRYRLENSLEKSCLHRP